MACVLTLAATLGGCGGSGGDSGGGEGASVSDAKLDPSCPPASASGKQVRLQVKITNAGRDDWPATYLAFEGGFAELVPVSAATSKGETAMHLQPEDFDSFELPSLAGGKTMKVDVLTKASGPPDTFDLVLTAWGGDPEGDGVPPTDAKDVRCKNLRIT